MCECRNGQKKCIACNTVVKIAPTLVEDCLKENGINKEGKKKQDNPKKQAPAKKSDKEQGAKKRRKQEDKKWTVMTKIEGEENSEMQAFIV